MKYKGKDQKKDTSPQGNTNTNPILIDVGSTNDNLDRLLDPAIRYHNPNKPSIIFTKIFSLSQPAKEAAKKEKDLTSIHSPNQDVPSHRSGPVHDNSGAKRRFETNERAQPLVKRRKAPGKKGEARDAAPFRPENTRMSAIPGERSSDRARRKPQHPGLISWTELPSSLTSTPTPTLTADYTQPIPSREKIPGSTVEVDPWRFPSSPDASNPGVATATPEASNPVRVTATPENGMQPRPDVPEETGGTAEPDDNASKETSPIAQKSAPSPAPASPFTIAYLVRWREPRNEYERWHPEGGKFLDKTLGQVILELSKRRLHAMVTSVLFKLSPADDDDGGQPTWRMQRDDEVGFGMMKKRLKSQISVWLKEKTVRPLLLEMEIEPICGDLEEADKAASENGADDVMF